MLCAGQVGVREMERRVSASGPWMTAGTDASAASPPPAFSPAPYASAPPSSAAFPASSAAPASAAWTGSSPAWSSAGPKEEERAANCRVGGVVSGGVRRHRHVWRAN